MARYVTNVEPAYLRERLRMRRPAEPVPVDIDLTWDDGACETVAARLIGWYAHEDGTLRSALVEWRSAAGGYSAVLPGRCVKRSE